MYVPLTLTKMMYLHSGKRENGLRIDALSSDYLTVTKNVYVWKEKYESPALIKHDGTYFMFASRLTGWDPNDNYYSTATSLSGPWSAWKTFADPGSNTYASQTTFVLPLGGGKFMYMGDRWVSSNLMRSTYVWLPLSISGTTASMKNAVNWIVDPSTGATSSGPQENTYEAESGTLANDARTLTCSSCSGGKSVGYIGGPASGTLTFKNVQSDKSTRTTLRVKHLNGDSSQRKAKITVNGKAQTVAYLPHGGGAPGTSVIHADLNAGANEIKVEGLDGGYGPDVDRILVPVS
jgi:hypothetical protein